jgi:quinol monooxygenase YgiN
MIHVVAEFKIKSGKREEFLAIFKKIIPEVKKEKGCIEYFPTIDIDSKLSLQTKNEDSVIIIEKWENLAALQDHTTTSHMAKFVSEIKDIVEASSVKIMQES